jgi:uncharacterized protein (TIGR00369 family)
MPITEQPLTQERVYELAPFVRTLGVRFPAMSADEVRAELDWDERRTTTGGGLHGGALMGLADSAGAVCAVLNLPAGSTGTSTVESTSYFVRAVRSGTATAVSRPLHVGRSTIVVETDVLDDDGRRCLRTTQVQAVLSSS